METIIEQPEAKPKPLTRRKKIIHIAIFALSLGITILFAIYLTGRLEYLTETYEGYGLVGVFLMGLIGSSAPI